MFISQTINIYEHYMDWHTFSWILCSLRLRVTPIGISTLLSAKLKIKYIFIIFPIFFTFYGLRRKSTRRTLLGCLLKFFKILIVTPQTYGHVALYRISLTTHFCDNQTIYKELRHGNRISQNKLEIRVSVININFSKMIL